MKSFINKHWQIIVIVILALGLTTSLFSKHLVIVPKDTTNVEQAKVETPTPTATTSSETAKPAPQTKVESKTQSQSKSDSTTTKTKTSSTAPKTTAKPTATPAPSAAPAHTRVTTGTGKTLAFKKGDTVCGFRITIGNEYFENKAIVNSPVDGYVTDGVIWPNQDELKTFKVVNPLTDKFDGHVRQATGAGNTLTFKKGDIVYGAKIEMDDSVVYQNVCIVNAPADGKVTDGVIWPWEDEVKNVQIIIFQ
jgi:hypothetical protein